MKSLWHGDKLIWPYLPGLLFHSEDPNNQLKITNKTDGVANASKAIDLQYSTDGVTWTNYPIAKDTIEFTLPAQGKDIYLRGKNPNGLSNIYSESVDWSRGLGSFHIRPTCDTEVKGNLQWLINCEDPDSIVPPNCNPATLEGGSCCGLFLDATNITSIDNFVVPYRQASYMLCRAMFAGCKKLKRVPRSVFTFLNNPECTVLPSHSMALVFANCTALDDCDLQFYSIKEIGSYAFADAFGGCPFRTHLVYDAMKNIEKADRNAFSAMHGAGWVQGNDTLQVLRRGYDIPRVYGTTGTTLRSIPRYTSLCSNTFSYIKRCKYLRNLNTYVDSRYQGYNESLPFYLFATNCGQQYGSDGVFVKYWADSWPRNTGYTGLETDGVPLDWKVVSCKPHYETASGVDEYCLASSSVDTAWHEDRRCDEYGNLL